MERQKIKEKMQVANIYARQRLETSEGRKIHYLKGCYHCGQKFIALRKSALSCCHGCGTSVNRKLAKGRDLSEEFSIKEIGNQVDSEAYPFWRR